MNVYDFDNTIYDGDSSVDFTLFCAKQKPAVLRKIPTQIAAVAKYKLKKIDKTEMKERLFSYLNCIDNVDEFLGNFWDKNLPKIKKFYLDAKREDDVIISASPEFLLAPACEKLGIKNLIASDVDKNNGKFLKPNCWGEQKVIELKRRFSNPHIERFYSDSKSDSPLARMADEAFIVYGSEIKRWEF